MCRIIILLLLFLLTPDRPPPKGPPEPDPPPPNIAGISNWGQIDQTGKKVWVFGHPHWHAEGEFHKGVLKLMWVQNSDGALAPGEYTVQKDGAVTGWWNWLRDAPASGLTMQDTLKPPFRER